MPTKKKAVKKEEVPKALRIYNTKIQNLQAALSHQFQALAVAENDADDASAEVEDQQAEIDAAVADVKQERKNLVSVINDLKTSNNDVLSIRSKLIKMSLALADLLEKSTLPPPKRKKRKKKVLAPVIPFVAPDVLESRSEV